MNLSRHLHRQLRLKSLVKTAGLLTVLISLAWLSTRHPIRFDITSGARNTLSSVSQNVLNSLTDPIVVKAYIKKDPTARNQIAQLLDRFKQHKSDIELIFIDPAAAPEQARALEIASTGTVFVEYRGRTERIDFLEESTLTHALLQLAGDDERWITFLSGHGERSPDGRANFDLGNFVEQLAQRNIRTQTLNLAEVPAIPDNSSLLVIAGPRVDALPGEIAILKNYVEKGGHLLWLSDPDSATLTELDIQLGIERLPGTIVDFSARLYNIDDPTFVLVPHYSRHPITQNFQTLTLFPAAAALQTTEETPFKPKALLQSSEQSWNETGARIAFDANGTEHKGPLTLAYTLTRRLDNEAEQRIVIVGDGDFLANAYLGNVGNLELGLRIVSWLLRDERYVAIPTQSAPDTKLDLSPTAVAIIGFGYLLAAPFLLLTTGLLIWRLRKRR
ncbi:MAG: Gldg family protein [Methylomicrobium sp.]